MTPEEMRKRLHIYCGRHKCPCAIAEFINPHDWTCMQIDDANQDQLEEAMRKIDEGKQDSVAHPNHYNRDGAMECWDEMLLLFGTEEVKSFCKLCAWKYRYRAGQKGQAEEDLRKSDEYLRKYKELCNNERE